MKLIPLTQGKFAQVDDADYPYVSQFNWCASRNRKRWYAIRSVVGSTILMHRDITKAPEYKLVDHWDCDGLNNQRYNLRVCTKSQNQHNQEGQEGRSSKFKGVCWCSDRSKWHCQIKISSRRINLGRFDNEEDAARAYDSAALKYHGEFARLNFPVWTSHNN